MSRLTVENKSAIHDLIINKLRLAESLDTMKGNISNSVRARMPDDASNPSEVLWKWLDFLSNLNCTDGEDPLKAFLDRAIDLAAPVPEKEELQSIVALLSDSAGLPQDRLGDVLNADTRRPRQFHWAQFFCALILLLVIGKSVHLFFAKEKASSQFWVTTVSEEYRRLEVGLLTSVNSNGGYEQTYQFGIELPSHDTDFRLTITPSESRSLKIDAVTDGSPQRISGNKSSLDALCRLENGKDMLVVIVGVDSLDGTSLPSVKNGHQFWKVYVDGIESTGTEFKSR